MKLSTLFTKSARQVPADETSTNAQLLIQAWLINKTMAWAYTFLPLGLRVLRKIEDIIRKHMDLISNEILMPSLAPKELWETTGRINYVDVLMKTSGANDASYSKSSNEYILNPTHEEVVTPLVQQYAKSYKDLPRSVYQIQTKFRNEARAKNWLLRGREFRMKDMYSFHTDEADLTRYYELSKQAYMDSYNELGIWQDTYIAAASGGDFTDGFSHEFQTLLPAGEDLIFIDDTSNECYNLEVCPSQAPSFEQDTELKAYSEVEWVGIIGVEELAKFLGIEHKSTTKTILFMADHKPVAVAVRWDYDVNELKLKKILWCKELRMLTTQEIKDLTGAEVGYAGIVNLPAEFTVICDDSIQHRTNFECGANRTNYHSINVNWGRDLPQPVRFYDIKEAKVWDLNPATGNIWRVENACEVGNIFPLNTKFSQAFDYNYINEQGKPQIVYMGCYGIGPSRIMGVLVEKFHDEKGMIWPVNVAPFTHVIIPIGDAGMTKWLELYAQMKSQGIDVAIDDRNEWPWYKFKDADLVGYPYQIVISDKTLEHWPNMVEFITRATGEKKIVSVVEEVF